MRPEVRNWVASVRKNDSPILEVGSRDVNGSVRDLFTGLYVGSDMIAGKGVNVVCDGEAMPFRDGTFGTVVSTETLEHVKLFWVLLRECHRILRPGGRLILTTVFDFVKHEYPHDYWRFTDDGMRFVLAEHCGFREVKVDTQGGPPNKPIGIFALATK